MAAFESDATLGIGGAPLAVDAGRGEPARTSTPSRGMCAARPSSTGAPAGTQIARCRRSWAGTRSTRRARGLQRLAGADGAVPGACGPSPAADRQLRRRRARLPPSRCGRLGVRCPSPQRARKRGRAHASEAAGGRRPRLPGRLAAALLRRAPRAEPATAATSSTSSCDGFARDRPKGATLSTDCDGQSNSACLILVENEPYPARPARTPGGAGAHGGRLRGDRGLAGRAPTRRRPEDVGRRRARAALPCSAARQAARSPTCASTCCLPCGCDASCAGCVPRTRRSRASSTPSSPATRPTS